jgi:ATP-dependent DNA helicase PIF1
MTDLVNPLQPSPLDLALSAEQEVAFNKYINKENIFITGPGGAGKTELIRKIYKHAINNNKHIQVCALTGCAALLLRCKAKTIHSWSGIGLGAGTIDANVDKVSKNYFKRKMWRETRVLIVDEVSMMSKKIFEMLDLIGKTIKKSNKPFGGIQLIFSGDFYQLPPVGNKDEPETGQFCFESEVWLKTFSTANHIQLIKIFRQTDPVYSAILNQLREGRLKRSSVNILEQQVNKTFATDAIAMPTKLYPVRNKVEQINNGEMTKLTGDIKTYESQFLLNLPMTANEQSTRVLFTEDQIETELNYIQNNLICDRDLQLKPGAQVMCVVNIELANGTILCNGSQGIVTRINELKLPVVRYNNGGEVAMTPHVWQSENIPGIGVSQIPLILAWALTIHKSQGATIDSAEIDVGSSVFECGQTYVALSRVKSLEGLYLTSFDINKIKINRKVRDFYAAIDEAQKGALMQNVISPTMKEPEEIVKKEETAVNPNANSNVRVIKLY